MIRLRSDAVAGESSVILLHPPLSLLGVSIAMARERQPNDRTPAAGGYQQRRRGGVQRNDSTLAIRSNALADEAGTVVLRGNLSPGGSVIKVALQLQPLWTIPTAAVSQQSPGLQLQSTRTIPTAAVSYVVVC